MTTEIKRRGGNPAWVKGKSGNPGGRPKQVKELQDIARKSCPDAIEYAQKLVQLGVGALREAEKAREEQNWDRLKAALAFDHRGGLAAATFIRDTGMGKPPQSVAVTGAEGGALEVSHNLGRLNAEQLAQLRELLVAAADA
jgi:hypothetical protein